MLRGFSQPYSAPELFACLWNNVFGPSRRYAGTVRWLPNSVTLNQVQPRVKLAFVGDILPFPGRQINIDERLRTLLHGSDYVVANFEGTILTSRTRPVLAGQRHARDVIRILSQLQHPERVLLACSNNHSGDYGRVRFEESCRILNDGGFRMFGLREAPSIRVAGAISITGATRWTNQPCDYVARFEHLAPRPETDARFNILYPHWGYEMQLYPNPPQVATAHRLMEEWDMVVGHHSHCPQPVTTVDTACGRKLLAYSLGDLLYRYRVDKYLHGIVLAVEIGPDASGRWAAGQVQWLFSRVVLRRGSGVLIGSGSCQFHDNRV